jgi:hypothetical protein
MINQFPVLYSVGIHRSVENVVMFLPLHPVKDASLTGCELQSFCSKLLYVV